MTADLFAEDFSPTPYWWEGAPRPQPTDAELPREVDVLVIGSGYTGLHAALRTARAGLNTLVLEADALGAGCSSRNGGQVSTRIKGSYSELSGRFGPQRATDLLKAGVASLHFLDTFMHEEQMDCAWEQCGHFSGAHNKAAHANAIRDLEAMPKEVGLDWQAVPLAEQHREIDTELYHGGILYPQHHALDAGRYHLELLDRVQSAGAQTLDHCRVTQVEKDGAAFRVHTSRGSVKAGRVAVATNGYTGAVTRWLQQRIIPIGSYIIATELLDAALAQSIIPNGRTITDTRKLVFYYRMSPDRRRVLFGGRVALAETDPRASAPRLHEAMCKIFPQLRATKISHSWMGFVGYTFDTLPHIGERDGLHYAMGYCGSGIALASYCGAIMGERISGGVHATPFTDLQFKTRPLYYGNPWFLKPSILYYQLRDKLNV